MTNTISKCSWSSLGQNFNFEIHPAYTTFRKVQGVYIMARRNGLYWEALYIGEAENLNDRVGDKLRHHEHWQDAANLGATHIHVLQTQGIRQNRLDLETALRATYKPPLNKQ